MIASVISAEKHPNADRLRVCMVDVGDGKPIQVVCGAPNARAGMKGVFAAPGAFIPGKNMTLAVGKIRDVESRGMLLSEAELMISDDHDGIIDLPADAPVGKSYVDYAGAAEPVIEINLTPNRPDCTGVAGIARDLGAASLGTFKDRPPKPVKGAFPCPVKVTIRRLLNCVPPSACGWCAASRTARRPIGCRSGSPRSACGPSTRWSTSPISSPSIAAARCTCSTPPKCTAI